jgi:hypothetical protein
VAAPARCPRPVGRSIVVKVRRPTHETSSPGHGKPRDDRCRGPPCVGGCGMNTRRDARLVDTQRPGHHVGHPAVPTSTRRPAGLTARTPAVTDSVDSSPDTADDTHDPGLTRPAGHGLSTFTPAIADSIGGSANTADHTFDRGANHPAGHLTRAGSAGLVWLRHWPLSGGKGQPSCGASMIAWTAHTAYWAGRTSVHTAISPLNPILQK